MRGKLAQLWRILENPGESWRILEKSGAMRLLVVIGEGSCPHIQKAGLVYG